MFCIYSSYAQSFVMKAMAYLMLISPVGGDLVPTMPGCVCPKVKDMGPFSPSSE